MSEITDTPLSLRLRGTATKPQAKIQTITQKARDNPGWTRQQLIEWAAEEFGVKPATARGYIYLAAKGLKQAKQPTGGASANKQLQDGAAR